MARGSSTWKTTDSSVPDYWLPVLLGLILSVVLALAIVWSSSDNAGDNEDVDEPKQRNEAPAPERPHFESRDDGSVSTMFADEEECVQEMASSKVPVSYFRNWRNVGGGNGVAPGSSASGVWSLSVGLRMPQEDQDDGCSQESDPYLDIISA